MRSTPISGGRFGCMSARTIVISVYRVPKRYMLIEHVWYRRAESLADSFCSVESCPPPTVEYVVGVVREAGQPWGGVLSAAWRASRRRPRAVLAPSVTPCALPLSLSVFGVRSYWAHGARCRFPRFCAYAPAIVLLRSRVHPSVVV